MDLFCPAFEQDRFQLCKHLVKTRPIPSYRSIERSRLPPFYKFQEVEARFYAKLDGGDNCQLQIELRSTFWLHRKTYQIRNQTPSRTDDAPPDFEQWNGWRRYSAGSITRFNSFSRTFRKPNYGF
eukprot:IDg22904t1